MPFREDEVKKKKSYKGCDGDKILSPIDLIITLLKIDIDLSKRISWASYQNSIVSDLSKSINDFLFSTNLVGRSFSELEDYKTIRMVGCMYKIISKLMANKLKKVLSKLIYVNHDICFWATVTWWSSGSKWANTLEKEKDKRVHVVKIAFW